MSDYLLEIEFAASRIIEAIWVENNKLGALEAEIAKLRKVVEDNYRCAEYMARFAEDPDDVAAATGMYWDNYFGEDKEQFHMEQDRSALVAQIAVHAFSVQSLSTSLLQYAKQGISMCHGKPSNCPDGRAIGGSCLREVVWQGRNQGIHWEEGKPSDKVQVCFDALAANVDQRYSDYKQRNMSFDVVEFLGWKDFASVKADMISLA
ncbi:hypothetical protein [Chromobacterium haemolyticum]